MELYNSIDDPIESKLILHSTSEMKNFLRNNHNKTYITVSNNPDEGKYTEIEDAINALPDEGGNIFIKKGNYTLDSVVIPDKSVTITGEDVDNTILNCGTYGFDIGMGYTKLAVFRNLQLIGASSNAIKVRNSSNGEIIVEKCIFDNNPEHCNISVGKARFTDNIFLNSTYRAIFASNNTGAITVNNNFFNNTIGIGIWVINQNTASILNNLFLKQSSYGISVGVNNFTISGNLIKLDSDSNGGIIGGIYARGRYDGGCVVSNNLIYLDQVTTINNGYFYGIFVSDQATFDESRIIISNNTINFRLNTASSFNLRRGIYIWNMSSGIVKGNNIFFSLGRTSGSTHGYGIHLNDAFNMIVSDNRIEMDNNANDYGVRVEYGSGYNTINTLYTYNVGTAYVNNGGSSNHFNNTKNV